MTVAASGCTVVSSMVSDNGCRVDATEQCQVGTVTAMVTAVITEQRADGSLITGEETINAGTCLGTYNVTWTRQ